MCIHVYTCIVCMYGCPATPSSFVSHRRKLRSIEHQQTRANEGKLHSVGVVFYKKEERNLLFVVSSIVNAFRSPDVSGWRNISDLAEFIPTACSDVADLVRSRVDGFALYTWTRTKISLENIAGFKNRETSNSMRARVNLFNGSICWCEAFGTLTTKFELFI